MSTKRKPASKRTAARAAAALAAAQDGHKDPSQWSAMNEAIAFVSSILGVFICAQGDALCWASDSMLRGDLWAGYPVAVTSLRGGRNVHVEINFNAIDPDGSPDAAYRALYTILGWAVAKNHAYAANGNG